MKLKVEDIPTSGLDIKQPLDQDWLKDILRDIGETEEWRFSAPISLDLKVTKASRNVFVQGNIVTNLIIKCSRCLKEFDYPILIHNLKYTFCPTEDKRIIDDLELSSEDLEFSFYLGEEIDISQVILEQVILDVPFKPLCHDLCRGLCYQCGMDLNKDECKCSKEKISNIGFSKLQDFRVESIK